MASDVAFDVVFWEDAGNKGRAFPVGKTVKEFAYRGNKGGRYDVCGIDGEARAAHVSSDWRGDEGK